ncbi:MAG: DNA polymerase III subunit gamma/tau [Candidatus Omnitrophica bacterium]|nr:DNA polymerase III subunit gamma/tau [Candidatus Omnitrophota bacterium]
MAYLVLARKYRPQNFEEVIGQEHITRTLTNAITTKRIASAYLFAGPRGVGKTSMARILAKALNCEKGPTADPCNTCDLCKEITAASSTDVLEIDGASNRGIDQIRQLRENVKFIPAKSRYKIYIIDEVHMLTTEAFNALLKTLEEPPAHIKFIFATTQPERVIPTILSRCQHFDFRAIKTSDILAQLKNIAEREGIKAEEEALRRMAVFSAGSLRDALSILDQLVSFTDKDRISVSEVNSLLGLVEEEVFFKVVETIVNNDPPSLFAIINGLTTEGKSMVSFFGGLLGHFRNILLTKESSSLSPFLNVNVDSQRILKDQGKNFSSEELFQIIERISLFKGRVEREESASIVSEVFLLSLIKDFTKKKPGREGSRPVDGMGSSHPVDGMKKEESLPRKESTESIDKPKIKESEISYPISDEEIKGAWPLILEEIKEKKRPLEACLQEGRIKKVKDSSMIIEFRKDLRFHKEMVEKNRKIIEEILKRRFARDFIVETAYGDREEGTDSSELSPRRELTIEEEKKIKKILDLFGGKIVSRKEE